METLDSFMKDKLNKELLKYTAGSYITCPKCGRVLDWKTVRVATIYSQGKIAKTMVYCEGCKKSGVTDQDIAETLYNSLVEAFKGKKDKEGNPIRLGVDLVTKNGSFECGCTK